MAVFCIVTAFFLFQGSSTWEGAAAAAPAGELPETGRFIATNSYPRNTVVDVTNIETNRTIRVIVANNLENPGLLALVSREAADLIGLRPGSVGRIRMIQPSEPIAFMRFTEGAAAGIPAFDPNNMVTEDRLLEELYRDDTYIPPAAATQPVPPVPFPARPGYIVDEPEWGGEGRLNIVDVPIFDIVPVTPFPEQQRVVEEPVVEPPVYIVEAPVVEEPVITAPVEEPVIIAQQPVVETPVEEPVIIVQQPEPVVETPVEEPVIIVQQPVVEAPVEEPVIVFSLVEAEQRTPPVTDIYGIDPSLIIPGITAAVPPPVTPITTPPVTTPPVTPPPVVTPPVTTPPAAVDSPFSVRTISALDRGQFYVQLAALPLEHVENTIRQIDNRYDPVVFRDRDNLYRVLIGPLNQGESAAVLRRFRTIGYTDAFVRSGS